MNKKIITSLILFYPSLHIYNHFNHESFITTETKSLDILSKERIKNNLVVYAIILLSMFKEEILEKTAAKEIILNIPDSHLATLLGNLVKPDGEKYVIGDLSFDDKKEILEVLRNKLLHGDFYLEGNKIVLLKDGYEGYIEAKDLIKMCELFEPVLSFKKIGPNYRPITLYKDTSSSTIEDIKTIKDFKRLMKNVKFFNIKDEPVRGYERTNEYVLALNEFFEDLTNQRELLKKFSIDNYIANIYNKHKAKLKKHHVTLEYEGKPITKTPQYKILKDFFINNQYKFEDYDPIFKKNLLINQASNTVQSESNDHLITSGAIINNMIYLQNYIQDKELSDSKMHMMQSNMFIDDMTIASGFNLFYSSYHYQLDEIYSNGKLTKLVEIVDGTYLDFSKLKLDKLDSKEMDIDVSFSDFIYQLEAMIRELNIQKESLKKLEQNYKKYSQKENKDELTEAKIKSIFDKASDDFFRKLELVQACNYFMNNNYQRYVRNFNIISHIRNAFAHGNVRILPYVKGDSLLDREIVINDIYEGKMTYTKIMKYKDFMQFIEDNNLHYIKEFIDMKISSIPDMEETLNNFIEKEKKDISLTLKDN